MTKDNSTTTVQPRKPRRSKKPALPKKPHKDFPLTAHPRGQWCKKVRGKLHYFGAWKDDPKGLRAMERWLAEKDDYIAGRVPRARRVGDEATVADLVNQFLLTKALLRDSGELSPHSYNAYADVCDELLAAFGLNRLLSDLLPDDFQRLRATWASSGRICRAAKKGRSAKGDTRKWGPVRLANEINRARVVFNYAYKNRLIPAPMLYGEGFKRPTRKVLRLARAAKGPRMFEADELKRMIDAAAQPMKAMLLLAINAALGNSDVAKLRFDSLDLESGWLNYPRGKTGIMRRCPLWPETILALEEWKNERPAPKGDTDFNLVFITVRGNAWDKGTGDRAVTHECRKLLDALKINGNRNFYAIRHTWETIAGESRDQVAVDAIMGHAPRSDDMASVYRERISDERLRAVVEVVRAWLSLPVKNERPALKIANESGGVSA